MRTETEILNNLYGELQLNRWWEELLGQKPDYDKLDHYTVIEALPRTEIIAARAIADKFRNRLSYVPATGLWYLWDGRIHRPCTGDAIARKVVREFYDVVVKTLKFAQDATEKEAKAILESGTSDANKEADKVRSFYNKGPYVKHRAFRDRLSTLVGQTAVANILKEELDISNEHFDGDKQYLVVRNGVIDIDDYKRTGQIHLLEHDPSRPVYRYFDATYRADMDIADYPAWRQYLASSIIDWDTVCLLQKGIGAAFSAVHKPRALFNLLGAPASGKSVFLSVFNRLGQDYSVMPNNQAIQQYSGDSNPYQDDLRGARFVGFSEVQGKKALDDGFIKAVMGGDERKTRKLYAQATSWNPQCVMFIASNLPLKIDTRDDATFGKVLPIPFPHSFTDTDPEHLIDPDLEDNLMNERDGILHWILQGMMGYWSEGLHPTAAVMAAMDENKTANSYALQFIKALIESGYVVESPDTPVSHCLEVKEAYKVFEIWCDENGVGNTPGKHTFSEDIAKAYHGKKPSSGMRFVNLGLTQKLQNHLLNAVGYNSLVLNLS